MCVATGGSWPARVDGLGCAAAAFVAPIGGRGPLSAARLVLRVSGGARVDVRAEKGVGAVRKGHPRLARGRGRHGLRDGEEPRSSSLLLRGRPVEEGMGRTTAPIPAFPRGTCRARRNKRSPRQHLHRWPRRRLRLPLLRRDRRPPQPRGNRLLANSQHRGRGGRTFKSGTPRRRWTTSRQSRTSRNKSRRRTPHRSSSGPRRPSPTKYSSSSKRSR